MERAAAEKHAAGFRKVGTVVAVALEEAAAPRAKPRSPKPARAATGPRGPSIPRSKDERDLTICAAIDEGQDRAAIAKLFEVAKAHVGALARELEALDADR